jgi:hypothetical protein
VPVIRWTNTALLDTTEGVITMRERAHALRTGAISPGERLRPAPQLIHCAAAEAGS